MAKTFSLNDIELPTSNSKEYCMNCGYITHNGWYYKAHSSFLFFELGKSEAQSKGYKVIDNCPDCIKGGK